MASPASHRILAPPLWHLLTSGGSAALLALENQMRREIMALAVTAVLLVLAAAFVLFTKEGFDTEPVQRSKQQNQGVNAPLEQAPSPGTVEDSFGDAHLPEQQ